MVHDELRAFRTFLMMRKRVREPWSDAATAQFFR